MCSLPTPHPQFQVNVAPAQMFRISPDNGVKLREPRLGRKLRNAKTQWKFEQLARVGRQGMTRKIEVPSTIGSAGNNTFLRMLVSGTARSEGHRHWRCEFASLLLFYSLGEYDAARSFRHFAAHQCGRARVCASKCPQTERGRQIRRGRPKLDRNK
jgi:hypothetical protein